jgi:hypothetical protein
MISLQARVILLYECRQKPIGHEEWLHLPGATTLEFNYFGSHGVEPSHTNVQLDWFKKLKPHIYKSEEGFSITP